jgi:hypothetical protein
MIRIQIFKKRTIVSVADLDYFKTDGSDFSLLYCSQSRSGSYLIQVRSSVITYQHNTGVVTSVVFSCRLSSYL